jgi:patatin-like phospholipase/acyl hydrolase
MKPATIKDIYRNYGKRVFSDSSLDDLRDLGQLIGADYSLVPLKTVLSDLFGDMTLGEILPKILISSFDLDNQEIDPVRRTWKPKFFHNFTGEDSDEREKVVDVALRTSAAPTYFPIYQGFIDGGVVAGNPAMCAVSQALHPYTGGQEISDLVLLSIGTGYNPRYLTSKNGDWGIAQWAPHIINILLEGSGDLVHYQCQQILGVRYCRVNVHLPMAIGMDRVDQIPLMTEIANQHNLTQTVEWFEKYFI